MKRILVAALLLVLAGTFCFAGGEKEEFLEGDMEKDEIVIGLTLMDYNFAFFQDMLAMAKKTADGLGVTLVDFDGRGKPDVQLQIVEDMIARKVDAIFLNPVDSAAIGPAVLAANDAGIPVVTVDVRSGSGDVKAHIASDNIDIGRKDARYAVKLLEEKYGEARGTVLVQGYPQITSMRDRAIGFKEIMEDYPNVEIIEDNPIDLNVQEAMSKAEDMLSRYPEGKVDIYFGSNSQTALGIIAAAETLGRDDIMILAVDEEDEFLNMLKDPNSNLEATVVQYPTDMGRLGVEYAVRLAKGEDFGSGTKEVATEIETVTKENIEAYAIKKQKIDEEIDPYK